MYGYQTLTSVQEESFLLRSAAIKLGPETCPMAHAQKHWRLGAPALLLHVAMNSQTNELISMSWILDFFNLPAIQSILDACPCHFQLRC